MTLLDTSIWIEYFKRNEDYKLIIDNLLRKKKVLGFDFIFGELLLLYFTAITSSTLIR